MSFPPKKIQKTPIIKKISPLFWEQKDSASHPNLQICNYNFMMLEKWEHPRNFGQFWRLYWNQKKGAQIIFQDTIYEITPDKVFLIPSHIATSTHLKNMVPHFSINFKVGGPFEKIKHKIFIMDPDFLYARLREFARLTDETARQMAICSIAAYYLSRIPQEDFQTTGREDLDPRIARAANILEHELASPPSNEELWRRVNMSRNNFYRLFLKETKKTPKFFLLELRMHRAAALLANTEKSLDEIALETGYSNRYHFSKVFRDYSGISPIRYRKES